MSMKKIAVLGNAGGGKSTLSKKLSHLLNIKAYHLDDLFKSSDGNKGFSEKEQLAIQDEILLKPSWIIEGVGAWSTIILRLKFADTIIIISHPLFFHYYIVIKRYLSDLFKQRKLLINQRKLFSQNKKLHGNHSSRSTSKKELPEIKRELSRIKKMLIMPWHLHYYWLPQLKSAIDVICDEDQTVIILKSFTQIDTFIIMLNSHD
ncbi:hypothetical protein MTBBW1_60012 [Desulfamplus magnetovallimortis]|uniref:Adenylate kinase n=1 Tax=Desulfamplus magnetovallimortis TaxID=1246637 RepID=A0A1W1HIA3_9BACT|nr:hypothetical protein [Desulfamplus magnetovallimortis]SLM32112.1 hypothetical protein MTBBW1_60012 [Desulfamplus magnetovallimortis]